MTFTALDKWIEDWKTSKIAYLDRLKEANTKWSKASAEAHNTHNVREEVEVKDWNPREGSHTKTVKAIPVMIDGIKYLSYREIIKGKAKYFEDCELGEPSQEDMKLISYYSREERITRVEKDAEARKKAIIAKVEKICTEQINEVAEVAGDGIYIRGANGKVAHMWAVYAGGYNIQCLHIRVLVKEATWVA